MAALMSIFCEPDDANFRYASQNKKAHADGYVYAYAQDRSVLDKQQRKSEVSIRNEDGWVNYTGQALITYFEGQFPCRHVGEVEPQRLYALYLVNKYFHNDKTIKKTLTSACFPAPSTEQLAIIKAALSGRDVKVQAFAGTGKTSTIKMIAACIGMQSTYVVFNRVAKESVEGKLVDCHATTAHSLAYHSVIVGNVGYSEKFQQSQKTWYLSTIRPLFSGKSDSELGVIIRTVKRFIKSPDNAIELTHITDSDMASIKKSCESLSQQALRFLASTADKLKSADDEDMAKASLTVKKKALGALSANKVLDYIYRRVTHAEVLSLLRGAIYNYKNYSDLSEITPDDFPNNTTYKKLLSSDESPSRTYHDIARSVLQDAQSLWDKQSSAHSTLPINHDCYLKIWQLSNPTITTPVIFIDESQDLDPVMLSVLRKQKAQKIWVGDRYQQIYAWRGAVNAMEKVADVQEFYLTETYRFDSLISGFANTVLSKLGEVKTIKSHVARESEKVVTTAYIARYNRTLIDIAIEQAEKGSAFNFKGFDSGKLLNHCRSIIDLYNHQKPFMDMYAVFNSIEELEAYLDEEHDDNMRKALSFCINANFRREVIRRRLAAIDRFNQQEAPLILITAHQSKGLEWDKVVLAEDFESAILKESASSEWNLLYVAITRAKQSLSLLSQTVKDLLSKPITSGMKRTMATSANEQTTITTEV